ncbi:hypothetical protein [Paraburkholderia phytofirmans]|uniref:hypothetical protein n=1 Tax=Paraburkholderia phytofirmans TaxID=261302 RepID=UPI0011D09904|nr:hypothetical protein [Paraburkholderia phytofirmans]
MNLALRRSLDESLLLHRPHVVRLAFTPLGKGTDGKRLEPFVPGIETVLSSIGLLAYPLVDQHPRFELHFHGESEHASFKSARLVPEHGWTALACLLFRSLEGDLADPLLRHLMHRYVDSKAAVCFQFVGIHGALSRLIYFMMHQVCILMNCDMDGRSFIYAYSAISRFGMAFEGAFMRIRVMQVGE